MKALLILAVVVLPSTNAFSAAPTGGRLLCNKHSFHAPSSLQMVSNTAIPASNYSSSSILFEDQTMISAVFKNNNDNNNQRRESVDVLDSPLDEDIQAGNNRVYCPTDTPQEVDSSFIESILSSYIGPRVILALVAILYGTNFPLGSLMVDNLPAAAATSDRMVLASIALSPFLFQLKPTLQREVLIGGSFVSLGYVAQSIALVDTSPALVSFLGSATVLVCPLLQWAIDKKPMGIKEAPQTWLAALLCLCGVCSLELFGGGTDISETISKIGRGDALSLVQAVGFGTGIYLSEKMMKKQPDQALPITSGLVATTAFFSMIWSLADGWVFEPGWESMGLPGLLLDPNMRQVALAVVWTGIISTSLNFCIEITAIGRVPCSEASVILATEPLWAGVFAALLYHETFGLSDYIGGFLMISACLVNTLKPSDINGLFLKEATSKSESTSDEER